MCMAYKASQCVKLRMSPTIALVYAEAKQAVWLPGLMWLSMMCMCGVV